MSVYDTLPSFVLGFHGCDREVAEAVLAGETTLRPSENDYDWLGSGIYFWENNPKRAMSFAKMLSEHPGRSGRGRVRHPAVVGAVVDPGACLNLLEEASLRSVRDAYEDLASFASRDSHIRLPENRSVGGSADLLLRRLDCAVIEALHETRRTAELQPFDTVRGVFIEGPPLYPAAGFHEQTHVQICVRSAASIKGYFRPMDGFDG